LTVLFRIKNLSYDKSISTAFENLKEKLDEFDAKGKST